MLLVHVLALTVVVTALNCLKPVHIDDSFFLSYAQHIAHHPTDPYGFEVFWRQWPEPARWELSPPVLPYWLATGVRLVGTDRPALLKVWMAPFVAMFAWAVAVLLRRFADEDDDATTMAMLWLTMLSPAVLPGVNLMLDVPAVALALAGIACLVRAIDRKSLSLAMIAGVLAGLAGQTKYTTLITPLVMLAYAVARRRVVCGVIACVSAAVVFAGIEGLIFLRYGDSGHFLLQLQLDRADPGRGKIAKLMLLRNLPPYLGGVAPYLVVLAGAPLLAQLTRRRVVGIALITILVALGGAVLALTGVTIGLAAAFDSITALIFVLLIWTCVRHVRSSNDVHEQPARTQSLMQGRDLAFLVAWVLLELIATVAVSPFAAARRVIGLIVAMIVLVARLAAPLRREHPQLATRALWLATTVAIITGLGYYAFDVDRATLVRDQVQAVTDYVQHQPYASVHTVWFTGHWSFQNYAEQQEMKPVIPGTSQLAAGDWLIVPTDVDAQSIELSPRQLRLATILERSPQLPWLTTVPAYYLGESPLEISSRPTSRVVVAQVIEPFVARTDWEPAIFLTWMRRRIDAGRLPAAALAELERWAHDESRPAVARAATRLLENYRARQAAPGETPNRRADN